MSIKKVIASNFFSISRFRIPRSIFENSLQSRWKKILHFSKKLTKFVKGTINSISVIGAQGFLKFWTLEQFFVHFFPIFPLETIFSINSCPKRHKTANLHEIIKICKKVWLFALLIKKKINQNGAKCEFAPQLICLHSNFARSQWCLNGKKKK